MFSKFKANRRYLNEYYLTVIGLLVVADGLLAFVRSPDWHSVLWFAPAFVLLALPNIYLALLAFVYAALVAAVRPDFSLAYLLGIPFAMTVTFIATAFLHNASHSSIKPNWLRRVLGEAMALLQLVGFPDWTFVHILHHQFSDDPTLDPHPPLDKTYWQFLLGMRQTISKVFGAYYFQLWGNDAESLRNLKELGIEAKLATFLKVVFWYLLLGPQLFVFFFVVSVPFKMAHYAWFNYATHVYTKDGVLIVNLSEGFYRLINWVAFGLYFHKNHHLRPDLFNPSKLPEQTA